MGKRRQNSSFFSNYKFEYEKDFDLKNKEKLIHNLFSFFEKITKEIDFSSFEIGFSWPKKYDILIEFKYLVRDRLIELLNSKLEKKHDFTKHDAYFLIDLNKSSIFVYLMPVYVYGKYCKFSRGLAQTEYFCRFCKGNGCKKCDNTGLIIQNSVEQLLSKKFVPKFVSKQIVLHGAGREDADVLMLGNGRPFVLEIVCPKKRIIQLEELESEINSSFKEISVNSLKFVSKDFVAKIKSFPFKKIYYAVVNCSKKIDLNNIDLNKKIFIEQLTPTRVEKRRALLKRKKEIIFLNFEQINDNEFGLKLKTSHGTYVKEFISGDNNKTVPSLGSILGLNCVCKQLDVLEICDQKLK
ncbi:MAG: tRNA pseudouridine(54/55) synthase Pus10 [Candidatus ainarchaeum sp.]|nr:tRNA pseudouridine(54/55) synthase Pus10 [Candidatus ainarchaeum sp.]